MLKNVYELEDRNSIITASNLVVREGIMKIAIAGTGYVGLSLAVLLAQSNKVVALDIVQSKVDLINAGRSPISDKEIEEYLATKELNLTATMDRVRAYKNADYVIIATPTDYDPDRHFFDTGSVESVAQEVLEINPAATIVIKSTVPIGFTQSLNARLGTKILFSPEFLREGKALYDNLYPSRIIVGGKCPEAEGFAQLLKNEALSEDVPVLIMNSSEAEAVKLFANTYLAMRVAFFNELDTFAEVKGLNAIEIIDGVSLDPRIGAFYNNPSFGYGGYCLPKDVKQMVANYSGVPSNLMDAIVEANETRKKHIACSILAKNPRTVGIYRLTMKAGSDNFRSSAVQDVMDLLAANGVEIIVYEPGIKGNTYNGYKVVNELEEFISKADIILSNRISSELSGVKEKVYTRDLFNRD